MILTQHQNKDFLPFFSLGLDLIAINQTGRKLALTLARGSEVRAFSCFNAPSRKFLVPHPPQPDSSTLLLFVNAVLPRRVPSSNDIVLRACDV
jgi:hypothetical protein